MQTMTDTQPARYAARTRTGILLAATTATGIVAQMIPGYAQAFTSIDRLEMRSRYAMAFRTQMQSDLTAVAQTLDHLSEADLAVLASTVPAITHWTAQTPLILIDISYAPVTRLPMPVGAAPGQPLGANVRVVRCGDERDFLEDLAAVGHLQYVTSMADSETLDALAGEE